MTPIDQEIMRRVPKTMRATYRSGDIQSSNHFILYSLHKRHRKCTLAFLGMSDREVNQAIWGKP